MLNEKTEIRRASQVDVGDFLDSAGSSLETFRYFKKRPLSILQNHFSTYVGFTGSAPRSYGHLDVEDGTMWLGICVSEDYRSRGAGKQMMSRLVEDFNAQDQFRELFLTVDTVNHVAISLYEKFNFSIVKEDSINVMMKLVK